MTDRSESPTVHKLMEELASIRERNARVEADKAWETSTARKLTIAGLTYVVACLYMALLGVDQFYLHAAIPTGGYLLSTLTIKFVKSKWIEKHYQRSSS